MAGNKTSTVQRQRPFTQKLTADDHRHDATARATPQDSSRPSEAARAPLCAAMPAPEVSSENIQTSILNPRQSTQHSNLTVFLAMLVGASITALPLGIMLAKTEETVVSDEKPGYDWSFEGECSSFNSSHWGPHGLDTKAFSFEFIVPAPHMGIAMTNTLRPHVPSAKPVYSDDFFGHMYTVGYNAILRVHASARLACFEPPFATSC